MKILIASLALLLAANTAFAGACKNQANEQKLHGAARASFIKKCRHDIAGTCATQADGKSLHGAARNSFVKKCLKG